MSRAPCLSALLKSRRFPKRAGGNGLDPLQLQVLRVQQGIWHSRSRAIVVVEGFDGAGKGGAIRALTEKLDPRGVRVHPIGPPKPEEQGRHWLYRFWAALPEPGVIAVFDRSWYGRVLVERVEGLATRAEWKRAYREIREFERALVDDGVDVVKVFLGISKKEQFHRFEDRLRDPYKQWKLTPADIEARRHWDRYVEAVDDAFAETHLKHAPWRLVPANHKPFARAEMLSEVGTRLDRHARWMERTVAGQDEQWVRKALRQLERSGS